MFGSRREREQVAALRAEVSSWQARLAADVSNLPDGGDPACRQALADAAERNNAAGALLASATTAGELEVARRIVIEGLTATRFVRGRQGLPLGPDLPTPASEVTSPTPVQIDGKQHMAHPDYHPSAPHWFPGQPGAAPAGYYRTPFWKKALAVGGAVVGAEVLGDAVGDLLGGGQGYGGGYGDRNDYSDGAGWGGDSDGGGSRLVGRPAAGHAETPRDRRAPTPSQVR